MREEDLKWLRLNTAKRQTARRAAVYRPGHMRTWPDGGWTTPDEMRAEKWRRFDPKPVKIVISRFMVIGEVEVQH